MQSHPVKLQPFSELDILIVAREVKNALVGHKVRGVFNADGCFVIDFSRSQVALKICPIPQALRLHLFESETVDREAVHKFSDFLNGLILRGIKLKFGDRVIYFKFTSQTAERILAVELTGKHANACVIDAKTGYILAVAFEKRSRRLKVGAKYKPLMPRSQSIFNQDVDPEHVKLALPHFYREVVFRCGKFDPSEFQRLIEKATKETNPTLYFDPDGRPLCFSPIELSHLGDLRFCNFDTYSEAVASYFELLSRKSKKVDEREKIRRRLLDELKKLSDFERYRRWGELILANLNAVVRINAETIEVAGERIKVKPNESPTEAAERFFKLFKKSKRGIEKIKERLRELDESKESTGVQKVTGKSKGKETEFLPYLEFRSPNGFKVLVGKSARSNEIVTFGLANEHDLFFHAKDVPGAHVVLKRARGVEVPDEDIQFAAQLALAHSKASKDRKGLVLMTERRFVQKMKGAPPGTVKILKETVLHVRLDRKNHDEQGAPKSNSKKTDQLQNTCKN